MLETVGTVPYALVAWVGGEVFAGRASPCMARRARNEVEPGVWHVFARGVERRLIFLDAEDREVYLRLLFGVAEHMGWHVLAYCLMPNHIHLLIETTKPNLGRGMHRLHGQYAQIFNVKYGRVGHLFQSRYGSRDLNDETQVALVFAYIATNPVFASLCSRPEDWEWSSYRSTIERLEDRLVNLARLRAHVKPLGLTCRELVDGRLLSAGLLLPG